MDYQKMTDEELVQKAQEKDQSAINEIFARYKNFVRSIIRSKDLFLPDGDGEDLLQEGMLGLFSAVNTYNGSVQFKSYAYRALNNSVALDGGINEGEALLDPETKYISSESFKEVDSVIKETLSKLEYLILTYYIEGYSYEEIGNKTGKNVKAIDNALQRIRSKIKTLQHTGKKTR